MSNRSGKNYTYMYRKNANVKVNVIKIKIKGISVYPWYYFILPFF